MSILDRIYRVLWGRAARAMLDDMREQTRGILRRGGTRFTRARDSANRSVPIEACFIVVVRPDDERWLAHMPGFVAKKDYPFVYQSRQRRLVNEVGYVEGARVLVDPWHVGNPKVYAAGERDIVISLNP